MITVLPVREKDRLSALYAEAGAPIRAASGAVVAADGEERLGYCLYELDEKEMRVGKLSPTDDLAMADGVLRSALHVAVTSGVFEAKYTDAAPVETFARLGFIKNDENRTLRIEKLFSTCQNCAPDA